MSIWSTFKEMKVHDSDHSEADPDDCGCPPGDTEVYLSSSWFGFPLRLSIRSGDMHADCTLTREQARELGIELIGWAARDEAGEHRTKRDTNRTPVDAGRSLVEAVHAYEGRGDGDAPEPQPA